MLRPLFRPAANGQGILGTPYVGVPAADLPTGFAMPGMLANDISQSDPAGCLYRVEIIAQPSAGVLEVAENGAFSFTGAPDGTYTGATKVYKNDVPDTGGYSFQIGNVVVVPPETTPPAPRFARPASDISKGVWQPSTGSVLAAMIDEVTLDSADYISASTAGSCEIALGAVADPGTSSNQVVRYEAHASGNGILALTVTLKQGSTTIASRTHATLPATETIHELRLTSQQCDAITNYGDLRLVFTVA